MDGAQRGGLLGRVGLGSLSVRGLHGGREHRDPVLGGRSEGRALSLGPPPSPQGSPRSRLPAPGPAGTGTPARPHPPAVLSLAPHECLLGTGGNRRGHGPVLPCPAPWGSRRRGGRVGGKRPRTQTGDGSGPGRPHGGRPQASAQGSLLPLKALGSRGTTEGRAPQARGGHTGALELAWL